MRPPTVVVDGNNVIGAVPDGWWRDRDRASRRLLARLRCYGAHRGGCDLVVVFDVLPRGLSDGDDDRGVRVHGAARRGRNAADDRIVALLTERPDPRGDVEVITSDRDLAERVRAIGAAVTGAGAFLDRLESCGC